MLTRVFKNSVGLRMIIIAVLTLIMLVPVSFVEGLISEREARRDEAIQEVSSKWGGSQTISGPIIEIPYKTLVRQERQNEKGVVTTFMEEITDYIHVLPENLTVTAVLTPEVRYRGIYEVILYRSKIRISGTFLTSGVKELGIEEDKILWKEAAVSLGISDLKGIKSAVNVRYNGTDYAANPGLSSMQVLAQGITIRPPVANADKTDFTLELDLNGSTELYFVPVGRETVVSVEAGWGNPSFMGAYLPETREVTPQKFKASWKILHLNRNYPQVWVSNTYVIKESGFGVKLIPGIDEYQKTMRTAKYAIMFLALTFLAFFMVEVLTRRVIHPIQYVLIGLALVIFYTLLLSISEQMNFNRAYWLASIATIALITLYTRSVLANNLATVIIFGILTVLYGFLFIILQLQDYALLLGSVGLFVILAVVMYVTRNIDWFAIGKAGDGENPPPDAA
ncbi:MAG: cell envelope integrity protein CreD [Candidatus Kapabacteria bacterium]|jgi:inner membrane protein|nr:cell envelope integrity protein CreD [Candidatus Kapabacteria bacterium]